MRWLISRPMPSAVEVRAQTLGEVHLRPSNEVMRPEEMRAALTDFDAVVPTLGDAFSAEVFAAVPKPRCRLLANFGVGYNHIDVDAAARCGIAVSNTPGAVTDATADLAMTLMLCSARRAGEGERMLRAGHWQGWHPTQMLGLHLTGKSCGIVGMGRIGQAIARRCHYGFGMKISYFSRSEKALDFPANRIETLGALAALVDVLVIAVPGGGQTHHLIDAAILRQMQPHAHLINIARGDVLDEAALIEVLQEGLIGGAGLDVYEFEPKVPGALRALDNVVLLPHLGTAALEVREAMGHMALDNIEAHLRGAPPPNVLRVGTNA